MLGEYLSKVENNRLVELGRSRIGICGTKDLNPQDATEHSLIEHNEVDWHSSKD